MPSRTPRAWHLHVGLPLADTAATFPPRVEAKYHPEQAGLFGNRARGDIADRDDTPVTGPRLG